MNALYSFVILYSFLSAVFGSQEKCLPSTCTETTEISDLQTTSSNQDNSILTLNSQAAELGENVYDLYSEIGKLTDEIKTLKSKNKEHEAEIESFRKTVTEMEFFVDQLDKNTTTTESGVDDLETKTTTLMENYENLSSVVENLDLNYELLNESFSDFEERSSSLVRVFETTNPPEIGSIAVPALTCKWVQVFVDVASSAAHSKAYGLLYRDGYPINEDKESYSYTSSAATGMEQAAGGTTSRMYVVEDTYDSGVDLYLGHYYWSADETHVSMKALCFA